MKIKNITIIISENVFIGLKKESIGEIETGGTLYGFKLKGRNEYIISGLTFFQHNDKKSKSCFERNDERHFGIINEIWEKDKSIMFIGDWHYHPSNNVSPSMVDFSTFNDLRVSSFTSSKLLCNIITCKNYFIIYVIEKITGKCHMSEKVNFSYI